MTSAPTEMFHRAADFLRSISIQVTLDATASGFLPGIEIRDGELFLAAADDCLVGDMLHEAGHIAVTPSPFRRLLGGDAEISVAEAMTKYIDDHPNAFSYPEDPVARGILQSGEQEAIAWSFAAAAHIGLPTDLPFRQGFDNGGPLIHRMLEVGEFSGINGLAAGGMTARSSRWTAGPVFPEMIRWIQV
jgi:hypothetical protein